MLFSSRTALWLGIAVFIILLFSLKNRNALPDLTEQDAIRKLWQEMPSFHREDVEGVKIVDLDNMSPYAYDSDADVNAADVTGEDGNWDEQEHKNVDEPLTLDPAATPKEVTNARVSSWLPNCAHFPDTSNILLIIIMKTGASEAPTRIPIQLLTTMRCLQDFLIFSDMEQQIAGQQIINTLNTTTPSVQESQSKFALYRSQKECPYDQEICNHVRDVKGHAWTLDKYKNTRMVIKAFRLRPSYDWYLVVDADTYISWPSMAEWLTHMDPTQNVYRGNAVPTSPPFAHGGSGYLLSQKTMARFNQEFETSLAEKWDNETTQICCGDAMFAKALHEVTDVEVVDAKPTLDGAGPQNVRYGPGKWCEPVTSLHHVGHESLFALDELERANNYSTPLLFRDVFLKFVRPHLTESRGNWNNEGDRLGVYEPVADKDAAAEEDKMKQLELLAPASYDNLHHLCEEQPACLSFNYEQNKCSTFPSIQMGERAEKNLTGGWLLDRIDKSNQDQHCDGAIKWP